MWPSEAWRAQPTTPGSLQEENGVIPEPFTPSVGHGVGRGVDGGCLPGGPQGSRHYRRLQEGTTGSEPQTAVRGPQVSLWQLPDADKTPGPL